MKQVLDYANTRDSTMISRSGDLTVVVATVGNVNEKQAVSDLEKTIAVQPSLKGNVWLGGPTTADVQIAAVSSQDLGRAELFALPFLILLLFFVFRGIRAASMPAHRRRLRHRRDLGCHGPDHGRPCRCRSSLSTWSSPSAWASRSTSAF